MSGEIGNQVADIARTEGSIRATNAAKEKLKNVNAQDLQEAKAAWEKANPGKTATLEGINGQIYQTAYNDALNASGFGTGGQYQRAIQAATAAGLSGGLVGDNSASVVAGALAGKTTVENNTVGDIAAALQQGKTTAQVAEEQVKAENERYKRENYGGMSAEACSVKMYTERREALKDMALFGVDFVPVVGDSVRPDMFYVEYTIDGGRPITETFKNAPGGK